MKYVLRCNKVKDGANVGEVWTFSDDGYTI